MKKKLLSLFIIFSILTVMPVYQLIADELRTPVIKYTFEDAESSPALFGNASLIFDEDKQGNVLYLDGSSSTYAEIPTDVFKTSDQITVIFDVFQKENSGNYFTYCIGKDNTSYDFFRIRENEIRNAITLNSYTQEKETRYLTENTSKWLNIALVFNNEQLLLYVDGTLVSQNNNTGIKISDMGDVIYSYLGKSLYDGDGYYNGLFDNFEVYDTVLNAETISKIAESNNGNCAVLQYTFEDSTVLPTLFGNAQTIYDSEKGGKVIYLDGSSNTYAQLPTGIIDGLDKMTIMFDVKQGNNSGNYFTFAFGKDSDYYNFFRIRGSEVRNAITVNSYYDEREVKTGVDFGSSWMSVAIVFDNTYCALYINGTLVSENSNTGLKVSDLGNDLLAYLGKSFYDGDGYFNGYFDNFEIYNQVLNNDIIKQRAASHLPLLITVNVGKVTTNTDGISGTDDHTMVSCAIDHSTGVINSIVQKRQTPKAVPVYFCILNDDCKIYIDNEEFINGYPLDLTYDRNVQIICKENTESYTLKAVEIAGNPVLPGMYADPDIDILDGKFWIYPTTDGVPGWGSTQFHAFSSRDLVHWTDEGVILDNYDKSPGLNDNGIQIASSKWSNGNAWAPAIEEKNGKYYFYFCGRILSEYESIYGEGMAIGVAWADSPQGPYTASDSPIIYPKMVSDANFGFDGQVIDPSVYTEGNTSYLLFGNGSAAMVTLNSDMTSVNTSTFKLFKGLTDFRESIAVFKRGNYYYFTWSCDDTGSENYHIKYGTSSSLTGNITNRGVLLEKDTSNGILATGHQSVIYIPESDRCFIAYHRFYTPLSVGGNVGHHRETCIDEITFNKKLVGADLLNKVTPSMTGTGAVDINGNNISEITNFPSCTEDGIITASSFTMGADEASELKAFGHSFKTVTHLPTCTSNGYDEHICTLCDYTYSDNFVSKTGHTIEFYKTQNPEQIRMKCANGDIDTTFVFSDYINSRRGDDRYNEYIDLNNDGIINAKDYALIKIRIKNESD